MLTLTGSNRVTHLSAYKEMKASKPGGRTGQLGGPLDSGSSSAWK